MNTINVITIILLLVSFLKSVIIGSKFNFSQWLKYGKKYTIWYDENITQAEYKPD